MKTQNSNLVNENDLRNFIEQISSISGIGDKNKIVHIILFFESLIKKYPDSIKIDSESYKEWLEE